jgi:hypothetical protein
MNAAADRGTTAVLRPWMKWLLRLAGGYNLLAGANMIVLVHESYKAMGLEKPDLVLPVQLVGMLVAVMGIGYLLVAADPLTNRNILLLGFLTKLLGPSIACYYIFVGKLPLAFLPILFFSDLMWLPPFAIILLHLRRQPAEG